MDYQQLEQGMTIHGDLALFQVKKAMPDFKLPEIAEWKWNRRAARYLVRNGSQPPRGTFSVYDSGLFSGAYTISGGWTGSRGGLYRAWGLCHDIQDSINTGSDTDTYSGLPRQNSHCTDHIHSTTTTQLLGWLRELAVFLFFDIT